MRPKLATGEIYHVYNRGVEKRDVFMERDDYFRFVHDLFEFNDLNPAPNLAHHLAKQAQSKEVGLPKGRGPRKFLVEILAFCLMPNHFHIMLRQKMDKGVTEFMRKLGTGYTNYFNQKYNRVGSLFQGKYKRVHINQESHFIHLPYYIHLNPLDLIKSGWRDKAIKNPEETIKFLETYRWSSYLDYIGKKNFPSVTQREFLINFFGGPQEHKKDIANWLKELDLKKIQDITLES